MEGRSRKDKVEGEMLVNVREAYPGGQDNYLM
jgi:hypothetical protein